MKDLINKKTRFLIFLILLLFCSIILIRFMTSANTTEPFIYTNASDNADTYIMQSSPTTNFGNSDILGIFASGSKMITLMNWTLPKGSGHISKITLNLYCKNWGKSIYPKTPIELHLLKENFVESETTWRDMEINPIAPAIISSAKINSEGFYSWPLKGDRANNSLNLKWGDTVLLTLITNDNGWGGIQCYSKNVTSPYYKPYLVVTSNIERAIPLIFNISIIKIRKTSALITFNTNMLVNSKILYGINSSNLNYSSTDIMTNASYVQLYPLLPNTKYYYQVFASNYVDSNYYAKSSIFNFTTAKDSTNPHSPFITFVFDDGYNDTYTIAAPILNKSSFRGVSAIITSRPDTCCQEGKLNWSQIEELQNIYGWEIVSHSVTHPASMTSLNNTQLNYELVMSKNNLESHGINVYNFVSPSASYNRYTEANIIKYYDSDRITPNGPINSPYNEFPLFSKSVHITDTISDVERWVDDLGDNQWLILVFHRISDNPTTTYEWSTSNLRSLVKYIESKGKVRIVTIREAQIF